jgi:hypothetical protein
MKKQRKTKNKKEIGKKQKPKRISSWAGLFLVAKLLIWCASSGNVSVGRQIGFAEKIHESPENNGIHVSWKHQGPSESP